MKLYLVQHGEAAAKDVDPERPLTQRGSDDVAAVAACLARAGIGVGRVIHSGKLRARQTAEILAAGIARGIEPGVSDRLDPLDDPAALDWRCQSGGEDTMLVGHLPFMANLAALLLTDDAEAALINYQPGSVLCLETDREDNWRINWMLRPELLR